MPKAITTMRFYYKSKITAFFPDHYTILKNLLKLKK